MGRETQNGEIKHGFEVREFLKPFLNSNQISDPQYVILLEIGALKSVASLFPKLSMPSQIAPGAELKPRC